MKITNLKLSDLKPYPNNPRINDNAVDAVAKSIKEFGFKVPIVIDKNNIIVTGHTRLKAAIKLGLKEVPAIRADDLTDDQIKAFRLADNKTGELAEWDFEKLEMELAEIDIDMTEFEFELFDVIEGANPERKTDQSSLYNESKMLIKIGDIVIYVDDPEFHEMTTKITLSQEDEVKIGKTIKDELLSIVDQKD